MNPLNPLMREMAGSFVRAVLNIAAGWLVAEGLLTTPEADKYVGAVALIIVSAGWSWYQKYRMRTKLVTAMAMPSGVSEQQVQAAIADPAVLTPPVTLSKDAVSRPMAHPPDPPKAA